MSLSTTAFERSQIQQALEETRATRVLEIGAFKGETTAFLSARVPEGGLVSVIDPMCWWSEVLTNGVKRHLGARPGRLISRLEALLPLATYEGEFWRNVRTSGKDNVALFKGLSTDPTLVAHSDPSLHDFDVVFIDGDHSYRGASSDMRNWGSRVRPGGRLLVHDATSRFEGIVRAIREWGRVPGIRVSWPTRDSLCVLEVAPA